MRKSSLVRALTVAFVLSLVVVVGIQAASFIEPYPIGDPDYGLSWDGSKYTFQTCTDGATAHVAVTFYDETSGGGDGWTKTPPTACTDTGASCGTGGTVYECVVDSAWTNGSMQWTFIADRNTGSQMSTATYQANTGPNAVSLSSFAGSSGLAIALVLPLVVLAGVLYTKRW